ncbi:hypothetical protein SEET0012_22936 [Salmonella enterica subsp. enterica serovar Tallahassee str. 0012]|nr:hypothetical protein SEET0012_22936 [Salmonella enterica subsp. enterica serovar Tallahassee str. 0012]
MKLKGYDFAGIVPIDFIDLLMQMTIVLHAGFTLFLVTGR